MKAARVREWSASQRPATPGLGSPAARGNGGVKAPGMARMQCRPQCHPYVHTQYISTQCFVDKPTTDDSRALQGSDPRGWLAQQSSRSLLLEADVTGARAHGSL
jgi:hypothetical protein